MMIMIVQQYTNKKNQEMRTGIFTLLTFFVFLIAVVNLNAQRGEPKGDSIGEAKREREAAAKKFKDQRKNPIVKMKKISSTGRLSKHSHRVRNFTSTIYANGLWDLHYQLTNNNRTKPFSVTVRMAIIDKNNKVMFVDDISLGKCKTKALIGKKERKTPMKYKTVNLKALGLDVLNKNADKIVVVEYYALELKPLNVVPRKFYRDLNDYPLLSDEFKKKYK